MAKNTGYGGYHNPFLATGGSYANPRRGITDFSLAGAALTAQMAPVLKERKEKEEEIETKYQAGKVAAEELYGGEGYGSFDNINLLGPNITMDVNTLPLEKFRKNLKDQKEKFARANALGDTESMTTIIEENATFKLGMTGAKAAISAINNDENLFSAGASNKYFGNADGGEEHHGVKIEDFVRKSNTDPDSIEFTIREVENGTKQVGVLMKDYKIELKEGENPPEGSEVIVEGGKRYFKKDTFIDFSKYSDANYLNTQFKASNNIQQGIQTQIKDNPAWESATKNITLGSDTIKVYSTDTENWEKYFKPGQVTLTDDKGKYFEYQKKKSQYSTDQNMAVQGAADEITNSMMENNVGKYDGYFQLSKSNFTPGNYKMDPTLNISKMDSTKMNAAAKLWHNMNKEKLNLGDWTGSDEDIELYKQAHLIQEGEAGYVEGEENYRDDISMESLIYQQLIKSSNKYGTVDSAKERNDLITTMLNINMLDSKEDYLAVNANRTEEDYNTYVNEEIVKLQDHFLKDFYKQTVLTNSPMYFMGNNGRAIETGAIEHTALSPKVATTGGDTTYTYRGKQYNLAEYQKRVKANRAMEILKEALDIGTQDSLNSISGPNLTFSPITNKPGWFQPQFKGAAMNTNPINVKDPTHVERLYRLSKDLSTGVEILAGTDYDTKFTKTSEFESILNSMPEAVLRGTEDEVLDNLKKYFNDYPDVKNMLDWKYDLNSHRLKVTVGGKTLNFDTKTGDLSTFKKLIIKEVGKTGIKPLPDVKK